MQRVECDYFGMFNVKESTWAAQLSVHTNLEASGEASDEEHSIFRGIIRRHAITEPCSPVTLTVDGDDVPLGWTSLIQSSKNMSLEDQ